MIFRTKSQDLQNVQSIIRDNDLTCYSKKIYTCEIRGSSSSPPPTNLLESNELRQLVNNLGGGGGGLTPLILLGSGQQYRTCTIGMILRYPQDCLILFELYLPESELMELKTKI